MVRNNYDLIPEVRCSTCGWYEAEENWCCFWSQRHNPDGFCDEGVGKCCRNCSASVIEDEDHRCKESGEIVDAMNVCEDWEKWTYGNEGTG